MTCCCSAQRPGQTTFSAWSILRTVSSLPSTTTPGSVNAWRICCTFLLLMRCGQMASLPFGTGGLNLRNAERLRSTAYWSSWADTLPMIREHHPRVADHMLVSLSQGRGGFHLEAAHESRDRLWRAGVAAPEWGDVDRGQRPGSHPDDEFPRFSHMGWQSFASTEIEEVFFDTTVWPRLDPTHRALVRSQRGPMASIPFFTPPVSTASRFETQSFRVLLLRHLWCQLPLCSATCRCGQPLDSRGHLRGACAHAGVLGRRGFPLESCAARICKEAGAGCQSTFVCKTWISIQGPEQTTADWKWSPTVCLCSTGHSLPWTPRWVSTVRADGAPRRQCAERDGAALDQARRTKKRTYPELTGEQGRARLVVLACETGGRWSEEAQSFMRHLARARARSEPREMRLAARRAWLRRWCTALACCAAQAFASSLLERRGGLGADVEIPSTSDVIWGDRHRG